MLTLPLIAPRSDPTLPTRFQPLPADDPPPTNNTTNNHTQTLHRTRLDQTRLDSERKAHNARSPLALLAADEAAIAARKHAIRNFGAFWIRPPGVPKTLQAMNEEEAERVEQEELARQEQNMRDLQARQQMEEVRARAQDGAEDEEGGEEDGGEERDLDEEIPDADDAEEEDEDGDETREEVSFNEESVVEGSSQFVEHVPQNEAEWDPGVTNMDVEAAALYEEEHMQQAALEMEEAELTGAARDEEELGIDHERNLDDSVPEAGSYQHTDTEVEDSTSESELQDSFAAVQSVRRSGRGQASRAGIPLGPHGGLQERFRPHLVGAGGDALARSPGSFNLSSSLIESSFVGSSPVLQRSGFGGRGRGRRRGRQS